MAHTEELTESQLRFVDVYRASETPLTYEDIDLNDARHVDEHRHAATHAAEESPE